VRDHKDIDLELLEQYKEGQFVEGKSRNSTGRAIPRAISILPKVERQDSPFIYALYLPFMFPTSSTKCFSTYSIE